MYRCNLAYKPRNEEKQISRHKNLQNMEKQKQENETYELIIFLSKDQRLSFEHT